VLTVDFLSVVILWLYSYKTGAVVILDVTNKKPISLQRLRGHDDEIHCICWAPLAGQETLDKGLYINSDPGVCCYVCVVSMHAWDVYVTVYVYLLHCNVL